ESKKIKEAQRARDTKPPAPSEMHDGQRHQRHSDHVRKFRSGIEERCRKRSFLTWKPVAGCLRACRKAWRLGDTQQDARAKDTGKSACKSSNGGKERPEERADAIDVRDAEAIEDHAGRNLQ